MRVSTAQAFAGGINSLQDIYTDLLRTQEQISTGKRVLEPADDPVAATRILSLQEDNAILARYRDNITLATNNLSEQEALLTSVTVAIQRLEELTIQAGSGALSNTDRIALAEESEQIYKQLLGIANTQNARGEYLFAGGLSSAQPFIEQLDGSVNYVGDEGKREVEIAGGSFISIRDSGYRVFQDIANEHRINVSTDSSQGFQMTSGNLVDEQAFDDYFDLFTGVAMPQRTTVTLEDNRDNNDPNFPDVPLSYSMSYMRPDGVGPINITSFDIVNEATVSEDGYLEIKVDLTAEMGQEFSVYMPVDEAGFVIGAGDRDGGGVLAGERTEFYIDRQERQGLLATALELTQILRTPAEDSAANQNLSDSLGKVLSNLDNAGRNVDSVSASIGARMNLLASTDDLHLNSELFNAESLAGIEDIDYAEALSNLTKQETILQAAQQSFVRIASLSLIDRL